MRRFEIKRHGVLVAMGVQWPSGWMAMARAADGFHGVEVVHRWPNMPGTETVWLDPEPNKFTLVIGGAGNDDGEDPA